jgi:protein ImuB
MVALWCRDWPVIASGHPVGEPVAVVHAGRVVATSPAARVAGVEEGQRRREAQRRCPDLVVVTHDPDRDARAFETIAAALESITHRIEILRPGVCLFPVRGPGRYFGGEIPLTARVVTEIGQHLAERGALGVGVADGSFAAVLAARAALRRGHPVIVAPDDTPSFLAALPTGVLADPGPIASELVGLWQRLGLRRLGDLVAIGAGDLTARFGAPGALAHRLATGQEPHPPRLAELPDDLSQSLEVDPPADTVDRVAFVAKSLADRMAGALSARGMVCVRVRVAIHTVSGSVIERCWREDGSLSARAIAQRVRWQVDGWLSRSCTSGEGVCRVVLIPEEVSSDPGRQEGFWGGATDADRRAAHAVARITGILGHGAVRAPRVRGGRGAADRVELVPMGEAEPIPDTALVRPWPGQVPPPSPALVWDPPVSAAVVDHEGRPVGVDGRGMVTGTPRRLSIGGGRWRRLSGWAGPWLYDERWWDPVGHRRRARFQMTLDDGTAHLVALEAGQWWVEATYD